ncbi:DHH family phosphoesterase [Bacillus sp. 2205SS5-2]|uniref:DHH family phosphoesterase n=1 Tax=Bacillus sp. 2205SS5-2 TaxID=3109031 RepID=UPI0030074325
MIRLITHNDLDGLGCGLLAKLAFKNDVEVNYSSLGSMHYHLRDLLEDQENHDWLLITDLSVNELEEKRISERIQRGGKANLIDHHQSALHLNRHHWASVSVEESPGRLACATSLFYTYLLNNDHLTASPILDEVVELIREYDTWEWEQHENVRAKQLNDLFSLLSFPDFEERMLTKIQTLSQFQFDEVEKKLLQIEKEKIERYINRKKRQIYQIMYENHCVGIVHAESYISELGNTLGKSCPHLDYIILLSLGSKRMSFRTIHDTIDVSEIAGKFNGGGHKKASGGSITEKAFGTFVQNVFSLESIYLDAEQNKLNVKENKKGSLYINQQDLSILLFFEKNNWKMIKNGNKMDVSFPNYQKAETYIKKKYGVGLARDKVFIEYQNTSTK